MTFPDNAWGRRQRRLARWSAEHYEEAREALGTSASHIKYELGWAGGIPEDDEGNPIYSTGKMVEMVMVAIHRKLGLEDQV